MPDNLTPERIAELKALCAAATPGPWHLRVHPEYAEEFHVSATATEDHPYHPSRCNRASDQIEILSDESYPRKLADSAFIAAARAALPEALAALEQRDKRIDDLEATLSTSQVLHDALRAELAALREQLAKDTK